MNTNTKVSTLQTILETISEECPDDFNVRSYSGRGMYGKNCLAVDLTDSISHLFASIIYYTDDDNREELAEAFENMRQDSMGRGIVVYFPDVEYVDAGSIEDKEFVGDGLD